MCMSVPVYYVKINTSYCMKIMTYCIYKVSFQKLARNRWICWETCDFFWWSKQKSCPNWFFPYLYATRSNKTLGLIKILIEIKEKTCVSIFGEKIFIMGSLISLLMLFHVVVAMVKVPLPYFVVEIVGIIRPLVANEVS